MIAILIKLIVYNLSQVRPRRQRDWHGHHSKQDEVGGATQVEREERALGQQGKVPDSYAKDSRDQYWASQSSNARGANYF